MPKLIKVVKKQVTPAIGLLILCNLVSISRGQDASESSKPGFNLTTKSGRMRFLPWNYRGRGFYPEGTQWAVPLPPLKAPVPLAEYEPIGKNSIFDEKAEPTKLWRAATKLLPPGRFEEAEQKYLRALELQPDFSHAAYQLACVYAMQEKQAKAIEYFNRACELRFSDYPLCYRDPYLGPVRAASEFPERLRVIRKRYLAEASKLSGTPVVFFPEANPSSERLPAILLLHGNARTHEEHFEDAKQWAKLGFVAIALPGSYPYLYGGFMWSEENLEVTHTQIQRTLHDPFVGDRVDTSRVFLLGFSQGAAHAFQVAALHPDCYSGAIPIGVGGGPRVLSEQEIRPREFQPRIWFVFGEGEKGSKEYAETWIKVCERHGWQCRSTSHPGGHQFPKDWDNLRPQIAAFLLAKE